MKFWDIYVQECKNIGKSANKVAAELNIASSAVTNWKNGRTPRKATLEKISTYFNVSADYLLGYDTKEKPDSKSAIELLESDLANLSEENLKRVSEYARLLLLAQKQEQ